MTTRIGREYEVMDPIDKMGLRLIKSDETIDYTDTSDVTLFTLPANIVIVAIICEVATAFEPAGANIEVDDGTTAGLYGVLESALNVVSSTTTSLGRVVLWPMAEKTSASSIKANLNVGGLTMTAGSAKFWLLFRPVSTDRTPEIR